jgi:ribosomal-protein-serine acetyltransferase
VNKPIRRVLDPAAGVELRSFGPEDAEAIFAAMDAERERLGEWLPWVHATQSSAQVGEFINRSLANEDSREGIGLWVNGELAGGCGLGVEAPMKSGEIGYWLRAKFEGTGIVTMACRALLDLGFGELGLHRIVICAGTSNLRSQAVPQRLGFTEEGVLREACKVGDRYVDVINFSMLDREWPAAK